MRMKRGLRERKEGKNHENSKKLYGRDGCKRNKKERYG
ncbi:hypothetical protein QY95_00788 [Bacillus thermotolerans]|uniref:Uncharacterized protein n=1 Tax=Bacillus thermotolerans TaxID=1221996 RepID=A0A0F5I776_BACTR|nr:hypothetical protein QY95_00788 [Bacillus thermotolerans]